MEQYPPDSRCLVFAQLLRCSSPCASASAIAEVLHDGDADRENGECGHEAGLAILDHLEGDAVHDDEDDERIVPSLNAFPPGCAIVRSARSFDRPSNRHAMRTATRPV